MTHLQNESRDQSPERKHLLSIPDLPCECRSQLLRSTCLRCWVGDLATRHGQVDDILLCLRIGITPSVVRDDIPVIPVEHVVEDSLDEMVREV